MKIGEFTISKFQIVGVVILLVGLIAGIYLVQKTQIFKPKAAAGDKILNAFEITDRDGSPLPCRMEGDPPTPTCQTSNLEVKIKLKPGGLEELARP